VVIVPVPSIVLPLVVVLALTPVVPALTLVPALTPVVPALTPVVVLVPAGTVVVVAVSCAKAVLNTTANAAPASNPVVSFVCFIFVLCLVRRISSVVFSSDSLSPELIQPHPSFVTRDTCGCIAG
jgi:hypothetical protein